ncbi:hypothetical protein ADK86_40065 [Streptomyces sp. NRRL F-5755]|nr:hypothetical protein ADK86_40065 [Streptomyces sp. NRRL F-5755]
MSWGGCTAGLFMSSVESSGGPVMSIAPSGAETLLGVFSGSDRETVAQAGEVSQQLGWIRSVIRR